MLVRRVSKRDPQIVRFSALGGSRALSTSAPGGCHDGSRIVQLGSPPRRDLAILLTLGFLKREVGYIVAWQASVVAAIAAAVGVPLGIVFVRSLWSLFAGQIGVPPAVDLPMSLLWTIPALVVLANVIALLPAVSAARTRPAHALRSE
jgi:ABC-type antimicrobial peptide transport system permease subunit